MHARPRWTELFMILAAAGPTACARGASPDAATPSNAVTTRYRLALRDNPVDPAGAVACFDACQVEQSEQDYIACLRHCPGFEVTPGAACGGEEVLHHTVCFTLRAEPEPPSETGETIAALIGVGAATVVAIAVCSRPHVHCEEPAE